MLNTSLHEYIRPLIYTTTNYSRPLYQRALLIAAAMSRQSQWRSYDPSLFPHVVIQPGQLTNLIYMDYLITLKKPDPAEPHNYASLILLPTDYDAALASSSAIHFFGAMSVTDFLCHPEDDQYFYSLQWDVISATCVILEGISTDPDTATDMFSMGTVRFLACAINLAKFELLGKPMTERRASLIISGAVWS